MGVEPTDAGCSPPPTDFEDQAPHRGRFIPSTLQLQSDFTDEGNLWQKSLPQMHNSTVQNSLIRPFVGKIET